MHSLSLSRHLSKYGMFALVPLNNFSPFRSHSIISWICKKIGVLFGLIGCLLSFRRPIISFIPFSHVCEREGDLEMELMEFSIQRENWMDQIALSWLHHRTEIRELLLHKPWKSYNIYMLFVFCGNKWKAVSFLSIVWSARI